MASVIPKEVKLEIVTRWLPATEATWKVALLTNAFVYASGTHVLYADVSANEVVGTGYTAGGATLSGRAVAYDGTNAYLSATNSQWTTATFTARYAVVYETSGGKIRAIYDFLDKTVTGGTFTIQWNASGLIKII